MIDTDKYEGHTPPHWIWIDWIKLPATLKDVDKKLMQDAPLILQALIDERAEVKRLREWKAEVERICRTMNGPNRDTALFIMTNEVEEE